MSTTIRVRGDRSEARRLLAAVPAMLSGRVADPTGVVEQLSLLVGAVALSHVRRAFVEKAAGGTDEAGDSWPPLSADTIAGRRVGRGVGLPQILRDTGRLLDSLTAGAEGNLIDAVPGGVSIGTNVKYARYHHEGTATIPARRLWPEPARWPARWWEDIREEVADGVGRLAAALLGRAW